MNGQGKRVLSVLLVGGLTFSMGRMTAAIDLGGVLKGAGIAILIKQFDDQLNDFINTLMLKNNVKNDQTTRVVPIISLGKGSYLGAAQVIGTPEDVRKVSAVAQIEGDFSGRKFRVKALVPVDSEKMTNLKRIYGVGVSAVIDVKL